MGLDAVPAGGPIGCTAVLGGRKGRGVMGRGKVEGRGRAGQESRSDASEALLHWRLQSAGPRTAEATRPDTASSHLLGGMWCNNKALHTG